LDDELCVGKCVVVACMVNVEVGADYGVDLGRREAEGGKVLKDVGLVVRLRAGGGSVAGCDSGIDEDVAAGSGFDEVAGENHL
jgi:hypothetical protein